jgi:hypothetical protein
MASVKVSMKGLVNKIKQLEDVLDSNQLKNQMGIIAVKNIKAETRLGNDLKNETKQASLAPSTIENRKYLEKFNSTGRNYQTNRSNLTLSGQLIESLKFEPVKGGISVFIPNETRMPYTYGNGGKSKPLTNSQLATYLKEMGREFLGLNDRIKKLLSTEVKRFIRGSIRRVNK